MMAFARCVVVLVILTTATQTTIAAPETPLGRFTAITQAADALTAWFTRMLDGVGNLAKAEDRRRLIAVLTDLNKTLYEVEIEKRSLLEAIRRNKRHVDVVSDGTGTQLQLSVDRVSAAITRASPLLREEYRAGGVEVESELRRSGIDNKEWVYNYDIIVATEGRQGIVSKLEASVNGLRDAGIALTKLIDALKQLP